MRGSGVSVISLQSARMSTLTSANSCSCSLALSLLAFVPVIATVPCSKSSMEISAVFLLAMLVR